MDSVAAIPVTVSLLWGLGMAVHQLLPGSDTFLVGAVAFIWGPAIGVYATVMVMRHVSFDQPLSQDPLGLNRADFRRNPRQVIPNAYAFDTRKTIEQKQAGVVIEHDLSASDRLNARLYGGTREVFQTLAFQGNGVIDLDRSFGGAGLNWTHKTRVNDLPLQWTIGIEADRLKETRKGFNNNNGTPGALTRNEDDTARNLDYFAQLDWTFAPQWQAQAGLRMSRVRFGVDDDFVTATNPDDSGSVTYRNTSPVLGLVWHASDNLNIYGNLGTGFETPTLAESAYRASGSGPNFALKASKSTQAELGLKARQGRHSLDLALFQSRSRDEIVEKGHYIDPDGSNFWGVGDCCTSR